MSRTCTRGRPGETITSNGGTWTYGCKAAGELSALTYPNSTVTYSPNALDALDEGAGLLLRTPAEGL